MINVRVVELFREFVNIQLCAQKDKKASLSKDDLLTFVVDESIIFCKEIIKKLDKVGEAISDEIGEEEKHKAVLTIVDTYLTGEVEKMKQRLGESRDQMLGLILENNIHLCNDMQAAITELLKSMEPKEEEPTVRTFSVSKMETFLLGEIDICEKKKKVVTGDMAAGEIGITLEASIAAYQKVLAKLQELYEQEDV
ncbi:MAG: hypothetical protein E7290_05720 [Lachnospiraceae bacterium]|nr:hypothetical protein [Lachnospiraceae bacterium]